MTTPGELDKYDVLEIIGRGSFGIIRKVRRKKDQQILCRKEISYHKMTDKEREQLSAELNILKGLKHPNIVAYHERDHLKVDQSLHIYMEYCDGGDLAGKIRYLKEQNLMAPESFVWSVLAQVVCGLYVCHKGQDPPDLGDDILGVRSDARPKKAKNDSPAVLHRDLKPDNIFLCGSGHVKIGDFGLSKIMASHDFASTYVGTPFYMCPEIVASEQYGWASDIWALGCILYELCTKAPPFNARDIMALANKIRTGLAAPLPTIYSTDLRDIISKCMSKNPQHRPDTTQLLNLPMIKLERKKLELADVNEKLREQKRSIDRDFEKLRVHRLETEQIRKETERTIEQWRAKEREVIREEVRRELLQLAQISPAAAVAIPRPPAPSSQQQRKQRAPIQRAYTVGAVADSPGIQDVDMADTTPMARTSDDLDLLLPKTTDIRRNLFTKKFENSPMDVVENESRRPKRKISPPLADPFQFQAAIRTRPESTLPRRPASPSKPQKENIDPREQFTPEKKVPLKALSEGSPSKIKGRTIVALASSAPAVWPDSEYEMPSPFLNRKSAPLGGGDKGGPGFQHLRRPRQ